MRGGAGDDILRIGSTGFVGIDGGTGIDTLALQGSGLVLDLRTATPSGLQSIEHIDLTGSGNNTLLPDELGFLHLTEQRGVDAPAVAIYGNVGDAVQMDIGGAESWSMIGGTVALDGVTYARYQFDPDGPDPLAPNSHAELWIDIDIVPAFI